MVQPIAAMQQIKVNYQPLKEPLLIRQSIDELILPVSTFLTKMLQCLPDQARISIHAEKHEAGYSIYITNTGVNLSRVSAIYQHLLQQTQPGITETGSSFRICFSNADSKKISSNHIKQIEPVVIPAYYALIRKRLTSYFTKSDNLVAILSNYNKRDALFLKKINDLINDNIEDPQMDANHLSRALNMSRTQLFRKLKPIIRQSPGSYIKTIKLEKAKKLFETTDLRINEVAYKTGFESPATFTKAFIRQFGVKPSLFCRSTNGTKE